MAMPAATGTTDPAWGGFRRGAPDLPSSRAPRWMAWTALAAAVLTTVAAVACLFGPMDEVVLAAGEVFPAEHALVFPREEGLLVEAAARPGALVRAGEVLARLDATALEKELALLGPEEARAAALLAGAEAELAATREAPLPPDMIFQARAAARHREAVAMQREMLARVEGVGSGNNLPMMEIIRARLAVQQAELELERAEQAARLLEGGYARARIASCAAAVRAAAALVEGLAARRKVLEAGLERFVIRAPADGLLLLRSARYPGQKVGTGEALFKIGQGDGRRLRLYASEDRIGRIAPGLAVRFRVRSDPDRLRPPLLGRVEEVARDRDRFLAGEGRGVPEGAYAVDVSLVPDAQAMPIGAAVDAEIVLGTRPFWRVLLLRVNQAAQPAENGAGAAR